MAAGPAGESEAQRARLFGLAYRLLGSAADAEDVVTAYCLAVERLLGIEQAIPERVSIIRVMMMEFNRIASHLMSVGGHGRPGPHDRAPRATALPERPQLTSRQTPFTRTRPP